MTTTKSNRTDDAMNDWIRAQAGYTSQEATDAPLKRAVDANAGNGANGPFPDVETHSQKMNRFIRQIAGRIVR